MLNVALPKGRLGEKVLAMFEKAGYECPAIHEPGRKLIFENPEKGVRYFWVKPSDVAIYVERGAADIGVAGKDILLEYQPEVYELLDLDLLEQMPGEEEEYDVDVLLLYEADTDKLAVAKAVSALTSVGKTVSTQKSIPQKLRYRKLMKLSKEGTLC